MEQDPLAASASLKAARRQERVAKLRRIQLFFAIAGLIISAISLVIRLSAGSDSEPVTPVHLPDTGTEGMVRALAEPGHAAVTFVAFSPDGKTLATGDVSGDVYLWNVATGKPVATLPTGTKSAIYSVAFSPDGTILAAAEANHGVWLWDVATHRSLAVLGSQGTSAAFSRDGSTLAVGGASGTVSIWSVASHQVTYTLTAPGADLVNFAAFSPNGQMVAGADENGSVYLWDVASRRVIATLTDTRIDPSTDTPLGAATDVSFSPDGTLLAVSYEDGSAEVWNVATGKSVAYLPSWASATEASGAVTAMFSPDGKTVAVAGINGSTALLDVASATSGVTIYDPGSEGNVMTSAAAYSPDGKLIAVAGGTLDKTFIWATAQV